MVQLTTGEKRSITSSMKKYVAEWEEQKLSFSTENEVYQSLYTYWVEKSVLAKLSWCKGKTHHEDPSFQTEMMEKMKELLPEVEKFVVKVEKTTQQTKAPRMTKVRSKKKRIRKKQEKRLLQMQA